MCRNPYQRTSSPESTKMEEEHHSDGEHRVSALPIPYFDFHFAIAEVIKATGKRLQAARLTATEQEDLTTLEKKLKLLKYLVAQLSRHGRFFLS